jgi:DNA polymerase-3 subunit delta'
MILSWKSGTRSTPASTLRYNRRYCLGISTRVSSPKTNPTKALLERFADGRLHHAILFIGQSNLSVEKHASELTRHVLGINSDQTEHPDLFHLRPSGKARIITVEKTRELISELHRTSNQGGAKVAIIHEVDRMRKEASNAFLKTLEEPPPDTYLFLLTTRPYSLLPTIRSRCLLARIADQEESTRDSAWTSWLEKHQQWITSLLDREQLKKDRISPLFQAYGLAASLLSLINSQAETESKEAKSQVTGLDDKEKDALESGVRRGVRSRLLKEVAEATRSVATEQNPALLPSLGSKLARSLNSLERCVGLMEVNLKDEAAIEEFYLSSLRIWSAR